MTRVAVFVDAGYVFAQGSVLLAGKKLPRGETSLDHVAAIAVLVAFAERVAAVPLLRVYWYDGTSTGASVGGERQLFPGGSHATGIVRQPIAPICELPWWVWDVRTWAVPLPVEASSRVVSRQGLPSDN